MDVLSCLFILLVWCFVHKNSKLLSNCNCFAGSNLLLSYCMNKYNYYDILLVLSVYLQGIEIICIILLKIAHVLNRLCLSYYAYHFHISDSRSCHVWNPFIYFSSLKSARCLEIGTGWYQSLFSSKSRGRRLILAGTITSEIRSRIF